MCILEMADDNKIQQQQQQAQDNSMHSLHFTISYYRYFRSRRFLHFFKRYNLLRRERERGQNAHNLLYHLIDDKYTRSRTTLFLKYAIIKMAKSKTTK